MAFTCVSSSIWNLLSDAAERLRVRGESLATLQIGFIPDYHYLVWGFFLFFAEKKKELFFNHKFSVYHGSVQLLLDLYLLALDLYPKR